jgi:hypothetical protein
MKVRKEIELDCNVKVKVEVIEEWKLDFKAMEDL